MTKDKQGPDAGRPYAGESPDARIIRRKQQFLEAGLELFGTVGYRAATVRALCKQARLTDRYFYESFAGTEDLLRAVYRSCMSELQSKLLQAIAGGAQPGADVRTLIKAGLEAFFAGVEDPRVARVIWLEILAVSPEVDQMYNEGVRSFAILLRDMMRNTYPHWGIADEEGEILAIALIGAVSQSTLHWLLSDYSASRATMVAVTSQLFFGLVTTIERTQLPAE